MTAEKARQAHEDAADDELVELIRERHEQAKRTLLRKRAVSIDLANLHGDRAVLLAIVDRLGAKVEELSEPVGFHAFVAVAERFLLSYPADIFTGESGDSGPGFVAALRGAVEGLHASTGPILSPPEQRIGERVRLLRERRNMTVSALARALGTDRSYVRQLECGKRLTVTLATAGRLAKALDTTVDWLAHGGSDGGAHVNPDGQT